MSSVSSLKRFAKQINNDQIRCCRSGYRAAYKYLNSFAEYLTHENSDIKTIVGYIEECTFHDAQYLSGSMFHHMERGYAKQRINDLAGDLIRLSNMPNDTANHDTELKCALGALVESLKIIQEKI